MILVTGSAGKTGCSVIQALIERDALVRALVYRQEQIQAVESIGARDVMVGDMKSQTLMEQAVQDVRAIYHICPNVSPDEVEIGRTVIAAAQKAGIEHIVFHSVLKPQTEAMPHHWKKMRVEELLIESSLPYTILQPAAYMQNILAHWDQITGEGIFPIPYPAETRISLVDLKDVAQAAAIVLTELGHEYASYELVGTEGLSQNKVAAVLSQEVGREVQTTVVPIETWRSQAIVAGLGDYQLETLTSMFRYYQRFDFPGNPHVLSWLLGRSPTSFSTFVERTALTKLHQKIN